MEHEGNYFLYFFFLGVLVNLHHGDQGGANGCGTINIDAIQQVVAAKWAIDVINNQSLPHELKIGKSLDRSHIGLLCQLFGLMDLINLKYYH